MWETVLSLSSKSWCFTKLQQHSRVSLMMIFSHPDLFSGKHKRPTAVVYYKLRIICWGVHLKSAYKQDQNCTTNSLYSIWCIPLQHESLSVPSCFCVLPTCAVVITVPLQLATHSSQKTRHPVPSILTLYSLAFSLHFNWANFS